MIQKLLLRNEGKTLEFKENCRPLRQIVKTVVAFANTAGGSIVIGVRNRTRNVIGLTNVLDEEERLANAFAENIRPVLLPDIQINAWRDREIIVVTVPHTVGPYYVKSEGPEKGVYVRLGSTNRRAGPEMISNLQRLSRNTFFDEQPCLEISSEAIDFRAASELFKAGSRSLRSVKYKSLGLIVAQGRREVPTVGAVLLFGKKRRKMFPDATIRCARFKGRDTVRFLDRTEIDEYLPNAVESTIRFIERHTRNAIEIGRVRHRELPEYPKQVIREAVINAIVHTDYSIGGTGIKVAIFDDRIEVTNPGLLPFGLTLEAAILGVSRLRNRVIGRVFRKLGLIEQWGSGMGRMLSVSEEAGLAPPKFEEIGANFRVTLYNKRIAKPKIPAWHKKLIHHLENKNQISTREAALLWKTTDRTARARLRNLVKEGILGEIGTSPSDPRKIYVIREG